MSAPTRWEYTLPFCDFSGLAVVTFNHIGCVYDFTQLFWVLGSCEVDAQYTFEHPFVDKQQRWLH